MVIFLYYPWLSSFLSRRNCTINTAASDTLSSFFLSLLLHDGLVVDLPSSGVLEPILVVEGDEEAEYGQEHDNVPGEDESGGAPLDDVRALGAGRRAGQDQGQGERREDDARRQEVAELKAKRILWATRKARVFMTCNADGLRIVRKTVRFCGLVARTSVYHVRSRSAGQAHTLKAYPSKGG